MYLDKIKKTNNYKETTCMSNANQAIPPISAEKSIIHKSIQQIG